MPDSKHTLQHAVQPVYFCSAGCKAKFAVDPDKFSAAPTAVAAPLTTVKVYIIYIVVH